MHIPAILSLEYLVTSVNYEVAVYCYLAKLILYHRHSFAVGSLENIIYKRRLKSVC